MHIETVPLVALARYLFEANPALNRNCSPGAMGSAGKRKGQRPLFTDPSPYPLN